MHKYRCLKCGYDCTDVVHLSVCTYCGNSEEGTFFERKQINIKAVEEAARAVKEAQTFEGEDYWDEMSIEQKIDFLKAGLYKLADLYGKKV